MKKKDVSNQKDDENFFDDYSAWQNAAGIDALKKLGEMSDEELNYYENL